MSLLDENIDLSNVFNKQFLGYTEFGTPGQDMEVLFDTGSSLVWIYHMEGCKTSLMCPNRDAYSDLLSSTAVEPVNPPKLVINYALGNISGHLLQDRFCFARNYKDACLA
jgi:hypothetical protein